MEAKELPFEFMLNVLRLIEGFPAALFSERTGLVASTLEPKLQEAEKQGLLERTADRLRPTERGLRFLNDLQQLFLP